MHRKWYEHDCVTFQCVYLYISIHLWVLGMRMVYMFMLYSFVDGGNENGKRVYVVFRGWWKCEWYMCLCSSHSWIVGMRWYTRV